jgi:addiction module HigA family antidote
MNALDPVHPGEILEEEFIKPLGLSAYRMAAMLHVPRTRVERLVRGETPVTLDTALRLARLFGTTAQFWINLQTRYDLLTRAPALEAELQSIEPLATA